MRPRRRLAVIAITVLTAVASATVAVAPAAVAAGVPKPSPVGPMRSQPKPKVVPDSLSGDPSTVGKVPGVPAGLSSAPSPAQPFDPARATVIDSQTTPTQKLYANADGSTTAEVAPRPIRFKDAKANAWRDIDPSLVAAPDGTLGPNAADPAASAHLSPESDATVATVETAAGTVGVRLPGATAARAEVSGATATYRRALGTRDLSLALTTDGVEESVILPDAGAGPNHAVEFALPPGVRARDGSV
ncbi:MAG TPA: hypothetical protein VF711_09015, partial [Acidimicrobiales bacterium]